MKNSEINKDLLNKMGKADLKNNNFENGHANGKVKIEELLYEGYYYDVTNWIRKHPGGSIIKFYCESGEDATCAVEQFHKRSAKRVMSIMKSFKKRPADVNESPLDEKTMAKHKALTTDFINLYNEFQNDGMFTPAPFHVILRLAEVLLFVLLGAYFTSSQGFIGKSLSVLFFTLFVCRSGWVQHEGGHHSLLGYPKIDKLIQAMLLGLGFGLSSTWWNRNHNMHHAMPNRFHRDHDLDTLPILAFNKIIVKKPGDGKGFLIQNQADLFLPLTNFIGILAWKIFLHPKYTIQKRDWLVLFFIGIHWSYMLYFAGLIPYLISVWLYTNYYFGNFSLSHTHLPVTEKQLHWVEYAFLHTMNIDPSWWCNWWMGYLNFQIEHHLFPTMPQFRGPKIRERVKAFAEKHGLPYGCTSYLNACKLTYQNMKKVSEEIKHL